MDKTQLIDYLREFVKPERWVTLNNALNERTDYVTVVLENIHQPHNASAVLRSCDGFGIQNIHVIEEETEFDASGEITIGADRWLDIKKYNALNENNTLACINQLKQKGYKIVATSPHEKDKNIADLSIDQPTALIFGNEVYGISDTVYRHADEFVKIPMYGFSESFNISVSAAICLYDVTERMRTDIDKEVWQLDEKTKQDILYRWLVKSIKAGNQIVEKYIKSQRQD